MIAIDNCIISFDLSFDHIDNRIMQAMLTIDREQIDVWPTLANEKYTATIEAGIKLPALISLEFSGKNYNTDTVIDQQGNILKDICIKIKNMRLDGLSVDQYYLQQRLILIDDTGIEWIGPYIGRNGIMQIAFKENNIFSQFIDINKKVTNQVDSL
jgi:hypothetical protein